MRDHTNYPSGPSSRFLSVCLCVAIYACTGNTAPGNDRSAESSPPPPAAPVAPVAMAIREADRRAIEPSTMISQEYGQLANSPDCLFRMTAIGMPILATQASTGVMKINGKVIELASAGTTAAESGQISLSAGDIQVAVTPLTQDSARVSGEIYRREADLVFTLKGGRSVGYRGYYTCGG